MLLFLFWPSTLEVDCWVLTGVVDWVAFSNTTESFIGLISLDVISLFSTAMDVAGLKTIEVEIIGVTLGPVLVVEVSAVEVSIIKLFFYKHIILKSKTRLIRV